MNRYVEPKSVLDLLCFVNQQTDCYFIWVCWSASSQEVLIVTTSDWSFLCPWTPHRRTVITDQERCFQESLAYLSLIHTWSQFHLLESVASMVLQLFFQKIQKLDSGALYNLFICLQTGQSLFFKFYLLKVSDFWADFAVKKK